MIEMHKFKDLISFANSVMEFMIGKSEENEKIASNRKSMDSYMTLIETISLDSLPVNWG